MAGAGSNPALGAGHGGPGGGGPRVGARSAGKAGGAVTLSGADVKALLEGVKDLTAQVAQVAQATNEVVKSTSDDPQMSRRPT